MKQQDAKQVYADIIDLPHHQSATRAHMSLYDRAAQFAPFAALTGFEDMVDEEARFTDSAIELSDNEIEIINGILGEIQMNIENGGHPIVTVDHFIPDAHKGGGRYEAFTGRIKRIDVMGKKLSFYGSENTENKHIPTVDIPIDRVIQISIKEY